MLNLLVLFVCVAAVFGADQKKIFPYDYDLQDFENGLRLVTVPTDYPNVVALYIVVQTGSRNEVEPGKSGFAHLFEHMMFRGTEKFPTEKYEAAMQMAGAHSNAYTSDDLTVYHTTFTKSDLEKILAMEADRFRNLKYTEAVFKTESQAVLGEYNKNSANPYRKLFEVLRETAFDRHTYRHTTMGFLRDIENMPNLYEYSLEFFDRYYRPEYTTIVVAGDVETKRVKSLVGKYWGEWERGEFKPEIPAEPPQDGPRTGHVDWPTDTLPLIGVAYKSPAYTDEGKDSAALDILSFIGFSETSDLYQQLVVTEQKVDQLFADYPDRLDPYLFTVVARVKNTEDLEYVQSRILSTVRRFVESPVDKQRLEDVKQHLRYRFSLGMDNSAAIAGTLAHYIALRRTPETINRLYGIYSEVTPQDIQEVARKYLNENSRTIVTLKGAEK